MAQGLKAADGTKMETGAMRRRRIYEEQKLIEEGKLPASDIIRGNNILLAAWKKGKGKYADEMHLSYQDFADFMNIICTEVESRISAARSEAIWSGYDGSTIM